MRVWIEFRWLKVGSSGGHDIEPSGSIKCGEFFDHVSDCQFFKNFAP
jgi:hypothetical protein